MIVSVTITTTSSLLIIFSALLYVEGGNDVFIVNNEQKELDLESCSRGQPSCVLDQAVFDNL